MNKMLSGRRAFSHRSASRLCAGALGFLLVLAVGGTAGAQEIAISGTVSAPTGAPLRDVLVRVQGTDTRTLTDAAGRYAVRAAPSAVLSFSLLGRLAIQEQVGGRTTIDVVMAQVPYLEEVVVTSYVEQRRADITGAVASVDLEATQRQIGASVLQRLDATAPGVTVVSSGSPGSRSTVRIRGISSFQNNDPLYIVDGVPVQDSYMNFLNPNDVTSIQVLKDASAASIYGSRANNGVVVIETTKKGAAGPPQVTLRARTGIASPVRGYDDFLLTDALAYHAVLKASYENAGEPVPTNIYGDPNNPTIPAYFFAHPATVTATDAWGRATAVDASRYSDPSACVNNDTCLLIMPGSAGTNWWDAVFGPAPVADFNVDISGGSDANAYRVSFNYFDQTGTAKYNQYRRGSVRVNTVFNRGRLNVGENIAVAIAKHHGGLPDDPPDYAEDGILGKNILLQPVVPVYDIRGNFAGGKCCAINQSNPLKFAAAHQDDVTRNNQIVGNVFAGYDATDDLSVRSTLGFNLAQNSFVSFAPAFPENAEATFSSGLTENRNHFTDWTWSNTIRYNKLLFSQHRIAALVGQEANASNNRYIEGSCNGLLNKRVDYRYVQDALCARNPAFSSGGESALLSFFGKLDYNFNDRYVASFTLRRDGSSRLSPANRWGTFPAFGLGWRITNEPFLANNRILSDVMLRYGWGVTGNQFIPPGRIVAQFGGTRGDTYYDVSGSNSIIGGYRQVSLGNPNLKWEENRSTNIGADMVLFDGLLNVVLDVYRRQTNNLLFDPRLPATAGIADPPIINVGKMRNTGFDLSIGHEGAFWSATLNVGHYKNKVLAIDGDDDSFVGQAIDTRFDVPQIINQVGHPVGSFYGLIADGYFRDSADAANHPTQAGAAPGRIKFRDVNGDGLISAADRTIIGNPHPDFTAGLDLTARRGNWDASATLFGTFGNDIFENQKEFYVFREFNTNVRSDLLANSWTPQNQNAKYPRLDKNDTFSWQASSYYVEDGSYIRLRSLQLGYTLGSSLGRWFRAGSKVYVQGENLFTITDYEGLDPALPASNVTGAAGDIRDQYRGFDRGSYPSNRVFSIGIVTTF
jgi:TonB-dependent starch-binding outer membrane protein SusC